NVVFIAGYSGIVLVVVVPFAVTWNVIVGMVALTASEGGGAISPPRTPTITRPDRNRIPSSLIIGTPHAKEVIRPNAFCVLRDFFSLIVPRSQAYRRGPPRTRGIANPAKPR